jgi:hypothetical protein
MCRLARHGTAILESHGDYLNSCSDTAWRFLESHGTHMCVLCIYIYMYIHIYIYIYIHVYIYVHRRALYDYYMSNSRHYAVATAAASYSVMQHYTLQVWGLYLCAVGLLTTAQLVPVSPGVPRPTARAETPAFDWWPFFFLLLLAAAPCCRPPAFRLWVFGCIGSTGFWVYGHLDFGPFGCCEVRSRPKPNTYSQQGLRLWRRWL